MSTKIEWAEETWNPTTGCDQISEGCGLGGGGGTCYALTMAKRLKGMGQPNYQNDGDPRTSGPGFRLTMHDHMLDLPFRWPKPSLVFVDSMSDLFHSDVTNSFIARVFAVMLLTPRHTFQILTKRPQRMAGLLNDPKFEGEVEAIAEEMGQGDPTNLLTLSERLEAGGPLLPNGWFGTSIELDKYTWRANHLRAIRAAVRFISAEPLLGPLTSLDLTDIDWLIAGGESGPRARPMHPQWVRDLRDRCAATCIVCGNETEGDRHAKFDGLLDHAPRHTAFFVKQWGEWVPYERDPQPPFWQSQHGDLIDGHNVPWQVFDPVEVGSVAGWCFDEGDVDDFESDEVLWRRVGKKSAGRLLDGREWSEYPTQRQGAKA